MAVRLNFLIDLMQTEIPYYFMRGGTSRGPYFNRADLPQDLDTLSKVLVSVVGSGHPLNIDGIGGGNAVTTKVAMLSKSDSAWADVDYFFAQVSVKDQRVDYQPTCGNILTAVASAAIEMGLVAAQDPHTRVNIHAVNTGAKVTATVQTPNQKVAYQGDTKIDGVPGTAAAVVLKFMDVAGSATGAFLPTGNLQDSFDGIPVTCMDVAIPMVIANAESFGLTGHENCATLNANKGFFAAMESVRLQAAIKMGMGDCSQSVTPKFGLLAPANAQGDICTRYFMPWTAHPTLAVTGSQCLAACALTPGTVSDDLWQRPTGTSAQVVLEHPMGVIEVLVDYALVEQDHKLAFIHHSAGLTRTCRLLAKGSVFIPADIWNGA